MDQQLQPLFMLDAITYSCCSFSHCLTKPALKLRHGWVVTSHSLMLMQLLIHVITLVTCPYKSPLKSQNHLFKPELEMLIPTVLERVVSNRCKSFKLDKCRWQGHTEWSPVLYGCWNQHIHVITMVLLSSPRSCRRRKYTQTAVYVVNISTSVLLLWFHRHHGALNWTLINQTGYACMLMTVDHYQFRFNREKYLLGHEKLIMIYLPHIPHWLMNCAYIMS